MQAQDANTNACLKNRHFPANMEQLMVIPASFGAGPDARLDISVQNMDEVLTVSRQVSEFCRRRGIVLRIRDDCVPFNPRERKALTDPNDILKNAGIRIVYQIAKSVDYQNLLGLNVLTIRI